MSEGELVNGAPADEDALGGDGDDGGDMNEQLDEEATALLKEMEDSQLEVQRMLNEQRAQASELGDMKESLVSELQQLQDESWKLQVFAELEMLKRQLAAINSLDADLDAMEARLDETGEGGVDEEFEKELAAARVETRAMLSNLGRGLTASTSAADGAANADLAAAGGSSVAAADDGEGAAAGADADEEVDGAEMEALQDALDAELAAMYKQLQDIKAESAQVAARKAQLELELMQLLKDGAEEVTTQLQDLTVEEDAAAEEEDTAPAAAAAVVAVVEPVESTASGPVAS